MRHFSAGKAFDETINSHTRVGSSIIQSKIIATIPQQQNARKRRGWRINQPALHEGIPSSIKSFFLSLVTRL